MAPFSERLNTWLAEQGKEPLAAELSEAVDEAMQKAVANMREHQDEIVSAAQGLAIFLTEARKARQAGMPPKKAILHAERVLQEWKGKGVAEVRL